MLRKKYDKSHCLTNKQLLYLSKLIEGDKEMKVLIIKGDRGVGKSTLTDGMIDCACFFNQETTVIDVEFVNDWGKKPVEWINKKIKNILNKSLKPNSYMSDFLIFRFIMNGCEDVFFKYLIDAHIKLKEEWDKEDSNILKYTHHGMHQIIVECYKIPDLVLNYEDFKDDHSVISGSIQFKIIDVDKKANKGNK